MNNSETLISIREKAKDRLKYDLVYEIDGARGRSIKIYPYKCIINTSVTAGSVLTSNATDGEKTIYYKDVIGIQYKKCGLTLGYLQFETASSGMNNEKSNFFNENTFTFSADKEEIMEEVYAYIIGIFDELKRNPNVIATDLFKDINTEKLNTLIEYHYRELVKNNPEYHDMQEILKDEIESLENEVSEALSQYNEVRTKVSALSANIQKKQTQIEITQGEIIKLKSYGKSSSVNEKVRLKEAELAELGLHLTDLQKEKEVLSESLEQKKEYHSKKYQLLKEKQSELRKIR